MTRAEQLHWWRQGYEAGLAAGSRQRLEEGQALHDLAVAEFRQRRRADKQAAIDALLMETIHVLAEAMLGSNYAKSDDYPAAGTAA